MKRIFSMLIVMLCLMSNASFSFAMRDNGPNEIDLKGELKPTGRSQADPITASVDAANLYVDFHADLGSLTITIGNATGAVVYSENVYAQANDGVQVSLADMPSGNYVVVFSARQGSLMGKFTK